MPPVRLSTFRGAVLEVMDGFDELRSYTQSLEWLQFAGKGLLMERLFRLHKWEEDK
jgi:hypothetical protein